jgi:hypothetical protein
MNKFDLFRTIGYEPHPGQLLYHNSTARFRAPVCGRRYGKSTMAGREREPDLFKQGNRGWIVGPTYDLGEKEFRVIWNDLIVGKRLGRDKRVKKRYNKKSGDMFIEFPWQARVEVRSADHPENLVGESLDWVIMSEAAKHKKETWERYIRPALADRRGGADFPTTPEGFNWVHEIWQLGQDPEFPDYASWRFPSWENTAVFPLGRKDPEILLVEKSTPKVWFEQEYGADFATFVGKIYSEWDETVHVQSVPFNPDWPSYMTIDWGYTNPLAAIEFQVDPFGRMRIWREWYYPYMTLQDHVRGWQQREDPDGYHLDLAFGDAADPEAAATISQLYVPCATDPMAKTNWREGVDVVKSLLKLQQVGEADEYGTPLEEPWLVVDRSCKNTIREFNNYRSKEPVKGQNVPEMGAKIEDHAMDAIRYGAMHLFKLGVHHLSDVYTIQPKPPTGDGDRSKVDNPATTYRELAPVGGAVTHANTEPLVFSSASETGFFTTEQEF